ncbi:ABC transporter substrate-binding protein [Shewanella litorisediminis]|uniref:ABC transporter substrate-binding protein n=1 Tax=Shewanella litorisediminis TaxID=1173586 RepID=A0ABX7FYR5_9GAMM|nr:ABC transporter substrate-binding protein [Shewanella litorisediminis]MCL2918853.1 ABC transporter substrate-binding protein [Shewanella litorisediminis]QRH00181.1 ABC transporter substrate-binding protein [Shewanella litorisediminis]
MKKLVAALAMSIAVVWYLMVSVDQGSANATNSLTIAVSATPLSSPIILAEKKGFFKKHGLKVQLKLLQGGHRCFDALIKNEADLATSSESVVMYNAFKRNDFSVIASFTTSDNDVKIIVRKDSGITSLTDISGHSVGMVKGTASEYFFNSALLLNGVDNALISARFMAPEELGQALLDKQLDAVSLWEPYASELMKSLNNNGHQLSTKGLYRLSFNLLSMRADVLGKQETHVRVLKALDEAVASIFSNPDEARQLVSDYLNVPLTEIEGYWTDYHFHLGLDKTLQLELLSQAHWAIDSGYVDQSQAPDFRDFIDKSALNQIRDTFRTHGGEP